jgi:hypothetical protein
MVLPAMILSAKRILTASGGKIRVQIASGDKITQRKR